MLLSQEFRNMEDPNEGTDRVILIPPLVTPQRGLVPKPPLGESPLEVRLNNGDILASVLDYYGNPGNRRNPDAAAVGVIVYIPPGRYEIGRPRRTLPNDRTELLCDFVVPDNVTLRFSPGATLVLLNYVRIFNQGGFDGAPLLDARRTRVIPGRPEDRFLVRMEIQGTIEAGIQTIFDCVTTDLRDPATHGDPLGEGEAAGHVYFTRNNVAREVFPEWFGAVSSEQFASGDPPPIAFVRRTTMALQEAIRVAHGRRRVLSYRAITDTQKGVSGEVTEVFPGPAPSGVTPRAFPGVTLDGVNVLTDGVTRTIGARSGVANGRWDFKAAYVDLPSIPMTLTGVYDIDTELSVGYTLDESAGYNPSITARFPDRYHQPNIFGAALRGVRGPGRQGAGSVVVRAAPTFATRPPVPHVPVAGQPELENSASLLAVRGAFGSTVEGIVFEGRLTAPRCVTLQVSGGGQSHAQRLSDCVLREAVFELLHIGGDFPGFLPSPGPGILPGNMSPGYELYNGNLHWSGNQDLLNSQFIRCAFDTGVLEDRVRRGVTTTPVGVMYRTGQSLSVEFSRCVFQGVASPMFHAWSLRFTLRECAFETHHDGDTAPLTAGTDIFFDNPINEGADVATVASVVPAAAMLKNVTSRSTRLITTFASAQRATPVLSAIQLINVVHCPVLAPGDTMLPAILWAGSARVFGRLVLIGCHFIRPRALLLPGDILEPVLADVVTGFRTLDQVYHFAAGASEPGSARGHVVDLGNRVESPGRTPELVTSLIGALPDGDPLLRLLTYTALRLLPLVDRFSTVAITER